MRKLAALFLSLCTLAAMPAGAAVPLPAPVQQETPLTLLGEGELTLWFFDVYDASLYAAQSPWTIERPFALVLRYKRDYAREDLVKATLVEIKRINRFDDAALQRWEEELHTVFADVKKGERITAFFQPPARTRFYHDERYLGEVTDSTFARPFFDIWLSDKTREVALRDQLLGLK